MDNLHNKLQKKHNRAERSWSQVAPFIIQVRVPVPFSLKWVNSYLLLENKGTFAIVDPGLRTAEAEQLWESTMNELSLDWKQCSQIIVTHQHPDHYGLAGYVQQKSKAPVLITKASKDYTDKLWGAGRPHFEREMRELLIAHGTPDTMVDAIINNLREFQERVEPQPQVVYIEAGQVLMAGDRYWDLIHTEGHAFGGIMLHDKQNGLLICGDQVLSKITPHVGVVAGEHRPVLAQFMVNLKQISTLNVSLVLPGHRDVFAEFAERIESILQHHERRLSAMLTYVEQEKKVDGYTCCEWLFGKHLRNQPHNLRFALTETIAHLQYLQQRNLIVETTDSRGMIHYCNNERR